MIMPHAMSLNQYSHNNHSLTNQHPTFGYLFSWLEISTIILRQSEQI